MMHITYIYHLVFSFYFETILYCVIAKLNRRGQLSEWCHLLSGTMWLPGQNYWLICKVASVTSVQYE